MQVISAEEFHWGCAGIALAISGSGLAAAGIASSGTPEQIARWVPECFGSGEEIKLGAYAVTEPQAGSDVKSLKTTAKRDGDEWVLNGTKVFITNGGIADVHVVVATVDPDARHPRPGLLRRRQGHPGPQPGQEGDEARHPRLAHRRDRARGLPRSRPRTCSAARRSWRRSSSAAAQGRSPARADALATFEMTRPLVGASALGIAQAAYEWTLEYLDGRSEGGTPLLQTQRIQQTLADVATEIEAARLLVQRAAWMGRNGVPMTGGQGSMSKLKAGDVTMWATTTLMDLVGPDAQSTELPAGEVVPRRQDLPAVRGHGRDPADGHLAHAGARVRRAARLRAPRSPSRGDEAGAGTRAESLPPSRSVLSSAACTGTHGHAHALGRAPARDSRRRMWSRSRSTSALLAAEVVGGILTGSLAVLADAGHLLSDVGSIGLALFAAAPRRALPAAGRRTFGYQRSEVLAALVNGAAAGRRRVADRGRGDRPPRRPAGDRRRRRARARPLRPRRQRRRDRRARRRRARGPQPRGRAAPLAPPTRSARSAWSSPAPSSSPAARRSSTRSSAC